MKLKRILIDTKDVQQITGRSLRSAQRLVSRIREKYDKDRHQFITIYELCDYLKLTLEDAVMQLNLQDLRMRKQ